MCLKHGDEWTWKSAKARKVLTSRNTDSMRHQYYNVVVSLKQYLPADKLTEISDTLEKEREERGREGERERERVCVME